MLTRKPITVILADDHSIFRIGFRRVLETQSFSGIQCIDEASNGIELLEKVRQHHPDIVMTDIKMPLMDGVQACRQIKLAYPATGVIALSAFDSENYIMDMLGAGANGYLVKDITGDEVAEAIKSVRAGTPYYCSTVSDTIYNSFSKMGKQRTKHVSFSVQEVKVMRLICKQFSTKEIAAHLKLAERTIEDYRHHLLDKTGARNVVGIAMFAIDNGIVKSGEL